MARSATGLSVIDVARTQLRDAKTIEELRCAQAVIFPLECGLSREDTANARGLSTGWAGQLRRSFLKEPAHPKPGQLKRPHPGSGSGRAYLSRQAEQELLRPFVEKARQAGILMVSERRQALEKKLGRTTATATTDNVLHRHGWRT